MSENIIQKHGDDIITILNLIFEMKIQFSLRLFHKSLLKGVSHLPCMQASSTCPRYKVARCQRCQIFIFTFQIDKVPINVPTCQRRIAFSVCNTKIPKVVPVFQFYLPKCVLVDELLFKRIFSSLNFQLSLAFTNFKKI